MASRVNNENELFLLAHEIVPGQSRDFAVWFNPTEADRRNLGLKLARHRFGATFKVSRVADGIIRVEATEPSGGYYITRAN